MSRKYAKAGTTLAALLIAATPPTWGQSVSNSTESDLDEETIVLSPFLVESSEDADSYRANATLAGTRVRTELRDVGSAVSVITEQFLTDTNSRNAADLLSSTRLAPKSPAKAVTSPAVAMAPSSTPPPTLSPWPIPGSVASLPRTICVTSS